MAFIKKPLIVIEFCTLILVSGLLYYSTLGNWYQQQVHSELSCYYEGSTIQEGYFLQYTYLLGSYYLFEDYSGGFYEINTTRCSYSQQDLLFDENLRYSNYSSNSGTCDFYTNSAYKLYNVTKASSINLVLFIYIIMWGISALSSISIIFISIFKCRLNLFKKKFSSIMIILWSLFFGVTLISIISFIKLKSTLDDLQYVVVPGQNDCNLLSPTITESNYSAGFVVAVLSIFPSFLFLFYRALKKIGKTNDYAPINDATNKENNNNNHNNDLYS